ncbi:MAG: AAA family ATPase [Anaerolineae bacterium]|nr:AAA family ATPase [Anaerolineae bacterium]
MKFKFHLFVQKHQNRTYTVTVLPFGDLTSFGINFDEIKSELSEAIKERVRSTPPQHLQHLEFDPRIGLQKVTVTLRPADRKNARKRREQVKMVFSVLVKPEDDGQLLVTVPKLGQPALSFYVFNKDELEQQASVEIAAWLDGVPLERLIEYRHARSETLETMEIDIPLRKSKDQDEDAALKRDESFWALREVGVNMTAQAAEGRFRRTYRRDLLVDELLRTVIGSRHNSILLTGASEVGKTAVLHELVRRIQRKECDEKLHDRQVWMLTPDRLIAGAQYIGTWEERIKDITNECRVKQHILYVEDLPGLLEVGRWSKSDSNIGMALRPYVAAGEVIIIGESSPERLTMGMNTGSSFMNLFRVFNVDALAEDETLSVLNNVARDLERELDLRIEPKALETTITLSRRFLPYRAFPGKAIRLLEETVADANKKFVPRPDNSGTFGTTGSLLARIGTQPRLTVSRNLVINTFSRQSGLPEFIVNDDLQLRLDEAEQFFRDRIIGQDQALEAMINMIATIKAGLNDPKKPLGTFLFIGPTGVGKTEMAKTLATYLFGDPARMIRFDMSEYGSLDGVSRLIGAFTTEGELTRRVREQPFCVVLLDEFEKADPRIYDIFLQVLGEGRLTDARGKTTSFHNAIIILTSNLGSGQKQTRPRGFSTGDEVDHDLITTSLTQHYKAQIERYFRPEFVNRIDQIVTFTQLTRPALRQIATRELSEILRRDGIQRRNMPVEIADSVIELVLEEGYSPVYGARPLKREIERLVVAPMARVLSETRGAKQKLLRLSAEAGHLQIETVPIEEAPAEMVTLTASGSDAEKRRMDVPALIEALAALRRKLADWVNSDPIREMQHEKVHLLEQTQKPDFWQNSDEARNGMSRFYFVDRLLSRLNDLVERAEYLEDFASMIDKERAISYQSDLARDYEALHLQVSFLDIELMTAHLPHRNQTILLIRPFSDQPFASSATNDTWARQLATMYLHWAERKGYEYDLYMLDSKEGVPGGMNFALVNGGNFADLQEKFAAHTASPEIALFVRGTNAFGFLKGERGLHRLHGRDSSSQDQLALVRVFAIPDGKSVPRWLRDYQFIKSEIMEGRRPEPESETRKPGYTIIRDYSLDKTERYARDLRTGVRLTDTKSVFGGAMDEFILAYLRTQDSTILWEDRYPPTFPY